MYIKNLQTVEIEFGQIDLKYSIDKETTSKIDQLFSIYHIEDQSIENLNKMKEQEVQECIDLLLKNETEASSLRVMSTLDFSTLMQKISSKLKEKRLWKVKKRQSQGKILYSLEPT